GDVSSENIRVLVVDDHPLVREGIRHVLNEGSGLEVTAEAASGEEALKLAQSHRPDVILLDISMPGESGLKVAAKLRSCVPEARILILSMHDHAEFVLGAVRAGVHGYVLKDSLPVELRRAVRTVYGGEEFFSPPVASRLSAALRGEVPVEAKRQRIESLTKRERQVLVHVAMGRSNKEVAAEFGISVRTVETHRENLMRKLDIHSVAELTRLALKTGLVPE
ncbi:MAG: response regulator transcription factor, partial [Gemmatimonadota bacterium]